jgi:hypothetical protein
MLLKRSRYLPDKKTEVVSWVLVKDIVSWKIDLENESLTQLIKEQLWNQI